MSLCCLSICKSAYSGGYAAWYEHRQQDTEILGISVCEQNEKRKKKNTTIITFTPQHKELILLNHQYP